MVSDRTVSRTDWHVLYRSSRVGSVRLQGSEWRTCLWSIDDNAEWRWRYVWYECWTKATVVLSSGQLV